MLSKELEMTLNEAFRHARGHRHEFMTVEHLLLALLDNEAAVEVLRACAADLDELRDALSQFIEDSTPLLPDTDPERDTQEALASYMTSFDSRILALRGTAAETDSALKAFSAYAKKLLDTRAGKISSRR